MHLATTAYPLIAIMCGAVSMAAFAIFHQSHNPDLQANRSIRRSEEKGDLREGAEQYRDHALRGYLSWVKAKREDRWQRYLDARMKQDGEMDLSE